MYMLSGMFSCQPIQGRRRGSSSRFDGRPAAVGFAIECRGANRYDGAAPTAEACLCNTIKGVCACPVDCASVLVSGDAVTFRSLLTEH
ncbi:MAG: hypothetical protein P4M14_01355 [Gammaproteobacteria bacterium]|nr:hypothetical protein [Gammaproteobacteria bacterium]